MNFLFKQLFLTSGVIVKKLNRLYQILMRVPITTESIKIMITRLD